MSTDQWVSVCVVGAWGRVTRGLSVKEKPFFFDTGTHDIWIGARVSGHVCVRACVCARGVATEPHLPHVGLALGLCVGRTQGPTRGRLRT